MTKTTKFADLTDIENPIQKPTVRPARSCLAMEAQAIPLLIFRERDSATTVRALFSTNGVETRIPARLKLTEAHITEFVKIICFLLLQEREACLI